MIELFGALVAGVLTTLAPCVLPLLPIIVGGSMAGALAEERAESGAEAVAGGTTTQQAVKERSAVTRALVITISLGLSILVFTLALKATTALIGIPPQTWQWVSGGVLIALGVVGAFPRPVGAAVGATWSAVPVRDKAGGGAPAGRAIRRDPHRCCPRPGLHLVLPALRVCDRDRPAGRARARAGAAGRLHRGAVRHAAAHRPGRAAGGGALRLGG